MHTLNHSISIQMGNLPPSKELFLRLENIFLIATVGEIIEIVSLKPNIETELRGWSRLRGHLYLGKESLKQLYSYKIKKIAQDSFSKKQNDHIFIPLEEIHRIENPGNKPVKIIEAQVGSILKESDIVRFQDVYGRIK